MATFAMAQMTWINTKTMTLSRFTSFWMFTWERDGFNTLWITNAVTGAQYYWSEFHGKFIPRD